MVGVPVHCKIEEKPIRVFIKYPSNTQQTCCTKSLVNIGFPVNIIPTTLEHKGDLCMLNTGVLLSGGVSWSRRS